MSKLMKFAKAAAVAIPVMAVGAIADGASNEAEASGYCDGSYISSGADVAATRRGIEGSRKTRKMPRNTDCCIEYHNSSSKGYLTYLYKITGHKGNKTTLRQTGKGYAPTAKWCEQWSAGVNVPNLVR